MAFKSSSMETILLALPEELPPNPAREEMISHAGKIDKLPAQILIGFFAAIAILGVGLRIIIQVRNRGKLFIDDYLVLFATCTLIVETGLLYSMCDRLWIVMCLSENPLQNIFLFTRSDIMPLLNFMNWNNVYLVFAWTTNYTIKMSFLAFFRLLVRDVSKSLNVYWWVVYCVTLSSWLFNMLESFIICGVGHSMKCFPYPVHNLEIGYSSTAADFLTDLLIVSIPILLLRKSQLRFGQKVRILVFLCLSVFMIAFALARLFGGLYRDSFGVLTLGVTWTHTWLHFESSVAVLMGGITAFRTVFAGQVREAGKRHDSSSTLYKRIRSIFRRTPSETDSGVGEKRNKNRGFLPGPQTGASIKGMGTFIRRIGREPGNTTMGDSMMDSHYDPLESYHAFRRDADANVPRASSNEDSFKTSADIDTSELTRPLPVLQTHNMV